MTDAGVRAFEMVAALDYERTAGSPQEAQAARSIVSALHSIGLSPHTQTFEIPLYQITRASFSVTSPASNALFFGVTGYGHSGNTPPEGLEAPFIYIENGEDSLLAQASGCIALLNIHPTPTLYHKMEAANVAGFVSISGAIDDDRRSTDLERRSLRIGRHVTSAEGGIPGLCIRAEDAARLLAAKPKRCKIILQGIFPSDASSFADVGIPAVTLYRTGAGGHSRKDTACLLHPLALQKTYDLALELTRYLGDSMVFPVSRAIPENVRQPLNDYFARTAGS